MKIKKGFILISLVCLSFISSSIHARPFPPINIQDVGKTNNPNTENRDSDYFFIDRETFSVYNYTIKQEKIVAVPIFLQRPDFLKAVIFTEGIQREWDGSGIEFFSGDTSPLLVPSATFLALTRYFKPVKTRNLLFALGDPVFSTDDPRYRYGKEPYIWLILLNVQF